MSKRASYVIIQDMRGAPLIIRDVGDHTQQLTVTNDVERVVLELHRQGHLPDGRKLHYYDSDNSLDEIVVTNGRYSHFETGGP